MICEGLTGKSSGLIAKGQAFKSANGRDKPMTALVETAPLDSRFSSPSSFRQHSKTDLENFHPSSRRQTDMISGLRSELLNIKSEVSKLLIQKPQIKTRALGSQSPETPGRIVSNPSTSTLEAFRDSVDKRSKAAIQIANSRPLEVENESLRDQLKNLKRRYVQKKEAHKEQVEMLKKKTHVLEIVLGENDRSLSEYKAQYQQEMQEIRKQLISVHHNQQHQAELENLRNQVEICRKTIRTNEDERHKSKETFAAKLLQYKEELEQSNKDSLVQANQEIASLVQKIAAVEKQCQLKVLREVQRINDECQNKIVAAETLLKVEIESNQKALVESYSCELSQIKTRLQQFTNQNITLKKELAVKQQYIIELKKLTSDIQQQKQKQSSSETELVGQLREEINSLSRQLNLCHQNLRKSKEEKDNCNAKLIEVSLINKQLMETCAQLEDCIQNSKKQNEELKEIADSSVNEEDIDKLKKVIVALESHDQQIQGLLAQREQELGDCQNQLNSRIHELKQLSYMYDEIRQALTQKDCEIDQIVNDWEMKLEEQELANSKLKNTLYSSEQKSNEVIDQLKKQIQTLRSRPAGTIKDARFDDALREQIEQIAELKGIISSKEDQIFQLRDHIACNRSQVQNTRADLQIQKLKGIAERKNLQVGFDVELQRLKNELEVQKKAGDSSLHKLKLVIDEIKSKDEFIQRCIMGKKITSEEKFILGDFLKEYQLTFPIGGLKAKLEAESKDIQRLERCNIDLMMELSALKANQKKLTSCSTLTITSSEEDIFKVAENP